MSFTWDSRYVWSDCDVNINLAILFYLSPQILQKIQVISDHLKEMYQTITIGGDAELSLVDTLDPFAEGIEFRLFVEESNRSNNLTVTGFN